MRNLNIGECVSESSFQEGVNGEVRLNAAFSVTNPFKPALERSQNPSPSFPSLFNIKPHSPQGLLLCEHPRSATFGCTCSFCSTAVLFTLHPVSVNQEKAHSYSAVAWLREGFRLGKGNILLLSVPNVFGSMRLVPGVNYMCVLRVSSLQRGFVA